jgi:hypothetical protein
MFMDSIDPYGQTTNPLQVATRGATDWGNIDMGIGTEARLRARLMALDEFLAQMDPNDRIGFALVEQEKQRIQSAISRLSASVASAVTQSNRNILHEQSQAAQGAEWAEMNPAMSVGPSMAQAGQGAWAGWEAPQSQYGAFPGRSYVTPGEPAERLGVSSQGFQGYDWISGLMTPQGLRPLAGDYAIDPIQQQQAAQQWVFSQNQPKTIEDWIGLQPQVELTAEQWRQQSERVQPRRTGSVKWLAAAAR